MGKTLGELAGFAMLLLIWILFLNMLQDFKLMDRKKVLLLEKVSLSLWGAGMFYLVLGGFFYNISIDQASIFQYDVLWGYGDYGRIMNNLEGGEVNGFFVAIYLKIAHAIGSLFFKQYLSAAIYTSFLFAITYGCQVYFLFLKLFGKSKADNLLPFVCFFPYAYRLFLPSPASMVCCLTALIIGGIFRIKNFHWISFFSNRKLKVSGWVYYFVLCILASFNIMIYYTEMLLRK